MGKAAIFYIVCGLVVGAVSWVANRAASRAPAWVRLLVAVTSCVWPVALPLLPLIAAANDPKLAVFGLALVPLVLPAVLGACVGGQWFSKSPKGLPQTRRNLRL